ncbi:MAG: protein phosphatase 2C domain-containing protein [Planctomycetaceae bacterium]|jgi:serine/threonine protein phosphatase PrpC|nr:protein phosphatase 2C domain-containing protein [Planctomycetaceae bacterium]
MLIDLDLISVLITLLFIEIVLITLLLVIVISRWIYESKNNMTSEFLTYKKSSKSKKTESVPSDIDNTPKISEPPKEKNRIAIAFEYEILQESNERPESYFIQQIYKIIDTTNIPAGVIGTYYELEIDFSPIANDLKIIERIEKKLSITPNNRELEVITNGNKIIIKGTPKGNAFDGNLIFYFRRTGQDMSCSQYPKPFRIDPNPRDIWKDIPVADYGDYPNKDSDARGATIAMDKNVPAPHNYSIGNKKTPAKNLEVIAASQRGRYHANRGTPRDDCFHFDFDTITGWNFVAVADGAGSAQYSRKGSELACHTVIGSLRKHFNQFDKDICIWTKSLQQQQQQQQQQKNLFEQPMCYDDIIVESKLGSIFHHALHATYKSIFDEAEKKGTKVNDYNTTLLCAAFKYCKEIEGWFIISYWVGDGGAAILRWNGTEQAFVLGVPDFGEYAGQTKFLTNPDEIESSAILKRLRFSFCTTFDAILFVTDGIADPFFSTVDAVVDGKGWLDFYEDKLKNGYGEDLKGCPDLFEQTKTPEQKAQSLLQWLNFWSDGNNPYDDRTILIVKKK